MAVTGLAIDVDGGPYQVVGVYAKKTLRSARRRSSPGQRTVARSSVSPSSSYQPT
jgi:hypothetical protein